ncbi:dihydrofolate reductase [Niabella sp. W65]|nr:dihydrofolate reductase [Niabella sp. W65]MCH7366770.1 dihydrofolate reductase [Niabella sp. W65]ULT42475.1 dihydrofolate reductase [Niabella sp. I65]
MTRVDTVIEGDTYFPVIEEKEWKLVSMIKNKADDKHAFDYTYEVWERK